MPISQDTLDFLVRNYVNDSREWFHAHREAYEEYVVSPLAELVTELTPAIAEIDPMIPCVPKVGKCISRVWRDTRRGVGLPIYRDVMWIIFTRDKMSDRPGLWFEFSPRLMRWGCGWYCTDRGVMQAARELIFEKSPVFAEADAVLDTDRFFLEDSRYKRSRYPDAPENERRWLDQRGLCVMRTDDDRKLLFSPDLAATLSRDFLALAPVYRYFTAAYDRAGK